MAEFTDKNALRRTGARKVLLALAIVALSAGGLVFRDVLETDLSGADDAAGKPSLEVADEPARDADVYGMITAVRGNQITVLELDPATSLGAEADDAAGGEEATKGENAISLRTSSGLPGIRRSGGMSADGPGGFGGATATTRADKLEELKKSSRGTRTVTVPVGITIALAVSGPDAPAREAGALTDLTSDTLVSLWLADGGNDGPVSAAYVEVTGKMDMDNSNNQ